MKRKVNKVNHTTQTRAYNVRAAATPLIVEGTSIVFDRPANLGGVTERIARSALDGVNLDDITLLVNHDGAGIPLARSPKTLTLTVADSGLEMRAELPDTAQGRAVYEAVKRGDLSEMSFAFDIGKQTFDERARERTITQIARVYEISIIVDDNIPAGTVLFGNFKYYGVNIPEGVAVEVSRESGFTSGLIDFRALCIADGKPIVSAAFVKVTVAAT